MIHKVKHKIRQKFPKGGFARNAATLMTGTAVAQALPIAAAPILTRIYSPADFGLFALYLSIVSPLSIISTARYESAIMLPEKDEDAVNLVGLSIFISIALSGIVLLVVCWWGHFFADLIGYQKIVKWFYLIPASIFLTGFYQSLNYWANRHSRYKMLATNRVVQSVTATGTNLFFGFYGLGAIGILLATLLGQLVATILIACRLYLLDKEMKELISLKVMKAQAKRYIKFPKYDIPSMFTNVLANQIPVFMFGKYFSSQVVGFYSLTNKVMGVPVGLISGSILDVFRQRASSDYAKYGNCKHIYVKTFKSLFLFAIFPFLFLMFFSPMLFSIIFGDSWRVAGEFASIMSVMFFLGFVVSPLSYVFFIAEKQNYNFIGQICILIINLCSIGIGVYFKNVRLALINYTIGYSIIYLSYLFVSYRLAKGELKK